MKHESIDKYLTPMNSQNSGLHVTNLLRKVTKVGNCKKKQLNLAKENGLFYHDDWFSLHISRRHCQIGRYRLQTFATFHRILQIWPRLFFASKVEEVSYRPSLSRMSTLEDLHRTYFSDGLKKLNIPGSSVYS